MTYLSYPKTVQKYLSAPNEGLRGEIASLLRKENIRIVVLDDDPTGIQTVQGNYLLTNWEPENVVMALSDAHPFFYILTNTRALNAADAEKTLREAMNAVLEGNRDFGYKLIFVSRSDSTLRGHFPLEPEVIREEIEKKDIPVPLPTIFTPAFFEAGRYTVHGVHYMQDGERLIPVSETEFARDNVFGYGSADLTGYIREKSDGRITPEMIRHIDLEELRNGSDEEIEKGIEASSGYTYLTLDAMDYSDLRKFSRAFLAVFSRAGGYAVFRNSSSLPKALTGIPDQPLLDKGALKTTDSGGLFIVGSHVKKTTAQLSSLLESSGIQGLEVDVQEILDSPASLLERVEAELDDLHRQGMVPVVYTSRREIRLGDASQRQQLGRQISDFLVGIVTHLRFQPAWLVAKGGITSHDILTKGLGVQCARVMGQVLPGVPALLTGKEDRFPEMPYIIFPGNVGGEQALREIYERLKAQ